MKTKPVRTTRALCAAAVLATLALSAPALAAPRLTVMAPTPAAQAATPATTVAAPPTIGLTPAAIVAWLTAQGLTPGAVEGAGENQYVSVQDGGLRWVLFFQSCQTGLCTDLQFSVGYRAAAVTPELVNNWNRDRRFLKAFYEAGEAGQPGSAVVQYDVFLNPGGPEQLNDHLAIWRGLLPAFARMANGIAAPAAPAAPPTPK